MAQPEKVEHSWLMYSFTAFLNTSLVENIVQPERVTGAGVTATEGLMLGMLLGLLDGSEDSWMAVNGLLLGMLLGLLDGSEDSWMAVNGLLLGMLLGLLDGSEDSWMAVMVTSLGLLDGFVDGFFDEVLLGAGVGEWHEAKHESRKSCCS
jgi:hypothetical protein